MKRRLLLLFLVFIMIFSLGACSKTKELQIDDGVIIEYDFKNFLDLEPGKTYPVRYINTNVEKIGSKYEIAKHVSAANLYVARSYYNDDTTSPIFVIQYVTVSGKIETLDITVIILQEEFKNN